MEVDMHILSSVEEMERKRAGRLHVHAVSECEHQFLRLKVRWHRQVECNQVTDGCKKE